MTQYVRNDFPVTQYVVTDVTQKDYSIGFSVTNSECFTVLVGSNVLTLDMDYTVEGDLVNGNGVVTLLNDLVLQDIITIYGSADDKRITDFESQARFSAKLLDNEFDNAFRAIRDASALSDVGIHLNPVDYGKVGTQLPKVSPNMFVATNKEGNAFDLVDVLEVSGIEDALNQAQESADSAKESAESAKESADAAEKNIKELYQGAGDVFPTTNIVDGTLFFYEGNQQERGLYIHFFINGQSQWTLISEEGPQGPQGIQGEQGDIGPKGETGATGPVGPQGSVGPTPNSEWDGSKLRFQQGDGTWGNYSDLLGPIGPQGVRGPQGVIGPIPSHDWDGTSLRFQQGNGEMGPYTNLLGPTGPVGPQGEQGPIGPQGEMGTSFHIDAVGTLAERTQYDAEKANFSFYATDFQVVEDNTPRYARFAGDGLSTNFLVPFTPDGQQSLIVLYNGVQQTPDTYSVIVNGDDYHIVFNVAPAKDTPIVVREVTLSTGYGAIFIKLSDTSGDWSDAIPFGKGPRGDQGIQGPVGPQGPIGEQGERGLQGDVGEQGPQGIQGPEGNTGPQGDRGPEGPKGVQGDKGIDGAQGPIGETGPRGATGPQGIQGIDGIQGPRGDRGPMGSTGPTGPTGPTGATGATGPKGPQGDKGPAGNPGSDGADGRSSSGVTKPRSPATYNKDVTVAFDSLTVKGSQAFVRDLVISGIGVQGLASGNGVGRASAYFRVTGSFGTVNSKPVDLTATNNSSQSGSTLTGYAEIPPIVLSVPANTTGSVSISLIINKYSVVGTASFSVTISPNGWWQASIIPQSTEIA